MSEYLSHSDGKVPDDSELIARIEQRDQRALSLLYERYGAIVYGLALRIAQNETIAEEATQDTFLKLWNQASRWDSDKGKFTSWLLTITRYTTIDRLRQEQRHDSLPIDATPDPIAETGIPHDPARQDSLLLRQLILQIPEEQAQVVEMAFFQGMTHRELAEKLETPLGTIKTRMRLGLQKLRALWIEANRERKVLHKQSEDTSR